MSTIVTDTLQGKTSATSINLPTTTNIGSTPLVSASANSMTIRGEGSNTTNVQQGLCKSWCEANAAGTAITDSFNISSVGDTSTGRQVHNQTNTMSNGDYSAFVSGGTVSSNNVFAATYATNCSVFSYNGSAYADMQLCSGLFGDLS